MIMVLVYSSVRNKLRIIWLWSGFLSIVCIVSLVNATFWHLHPILQRVSGIKLLRSEFVVISTNSLVTILFGSLVIFSVTGLLGAISSAGTCTSWEK